MIAAPISAQAADLGTFAGEMLPVLRLADHEVGGGGTDLRAVHLDPNMADLGMAAAFGEAVDHAMLADAVAFEACADTGVHHGSPFRVEPSNGLPTAQGCADASRRLTCAALPRIFLGMRV
jgi:hypothetical protein